LEDGFGKFGRISRVDVKYGYGFVEFGSSLSVSILNQRNRK